MKVQLVGVVTATYVLVITFALLPSPRSATEIHKDRVPLQEQRRSIYDTYPYYSNIVNKLSKLLSIGRKKRAVYINFARVMPWDTTFPVGSNNRMRDFAYDLVDDDESTDTTDKEGKDMIIEQAIKNPDRVRSMSQAFFATLGRRGLPSASSTDTIKKRRFTSQGDLTILRELLLDELSEMEKEAIMQLQGKRVQEPSGSTSH